ncbi:uncharacterized protein LOC106058071 isoform X1 [Biomphalaria glabrata]|uniref:Uncharacterized protein LOC106058071 isoform X1 n=1 Tax=Biomphalaria glabrata TaxID=6526 RepID=A0A9W2ZG04_BIOGL|nr:uncharacterized protein LOC106058071 isoform X1 [Biomphalaria glabrata]
MKLGIILRVIFLLFNIPLTQEVSSGAWTTWSEWECNLNCYNPRMLRKRNCTDPNVTEAIVYCIGHNQEHSQATCKVICPKDCPRLTWGTNCTNNCINCDPDCDKNTGECRICKPGYRFPRLSCTKECRKFYYGKNCQGKCKIKCHGEDCQERVNGTCFIAEEKMLPSPAWLLLLTIPISLLMIMWLRSRRVEVPDVATASKVYNDRDSKESKESLMARLSTQLRTGSRQMIRQMISMDKLSTHSEERLYMDDEVNGSSV